MTPAIADIRTDYKLRSLLEEDVLHDPIDQFTLWWNEAINSEIEEVNAMTLATATISGVPSARIVLLKDLTQNGFIFYSNYLSHKGRELAENPVAALIFFWKELERQVRIEGTVEKISAAESDEYFNSRPVKSKIGAWASQQSEVVDSRGVLEKNFEEYASQYHEKAVPRPPHWGGYIVKPSKIEFWQGRRSRLHDRLQYTRQDQDWKMERLSP